MSQRDYENDLEQLEKLARKNSRGRRVILGITIVAAAALIGGVTWFLIHYCSQVGCSVTMPGWLRNPTIEATATLMVEAFPTPTATPAPAITGELEVGPGIPCQAGTESWHLVTVHNTSQSQADFSLLPEGANLYPVEEEPEALKCPDQLPELVSVISLEGQETGFFLLQFQMPVEVPIVLKVGDTILHKSGLMPANTEFKGSLVPSKDYFVKGYDNEVAIQFSSNFEGRYRMICNNGNQNPPSIDVEVEDANTPVSVECQLKADSATGTWAVAAHRLTRDGKLIDEILAQTEFEVQDAIYDLEIVPKDYVGLFWGSDTGDVGLVVTYEIKNKGNVPVEPGIWLELQDNVREYQIGVLDSEQTLRGEVKEVGDESIQLLLDGDTKPTIFKFIEKTGDGAKLPALDPCLRDEAPCELITAAVWLKTQYLTSIDEAKAIKYTLVLQLPDSQFKHVEEITQKPDASIEYGAK